MHEDKKQNSSYRLDREMYAREATAGRVDISASVSSKISLKELLILKICSGEHYQR